MHAMPTIPITGRTRASLRRNTAEWMRTYPLDPPVTCQTEYPWLTFIPEWPHWPKKWNVEQAQQMNGSPPVEFLFSTVVIGGKTYEITSISMKEGKTHATE